MENRKIILGLFDNEENTVSAIKELYDSPWTVEEVYSPVPGHDLADALKLKKSRVGYFTLAGAVFGFFFGFWIAVWTAGQWDLIVSGKPVISLIPFFIVGFELTILFGVAANVLGFLLFAGLPRLKLPKHYDPRCSGEYFGVAAACSHHEQDQLITFFQTKGADIGAMD